MSSAPTRLFYVRLSSVFVCVCESDLQARFITLQLRLAGGLNRRPIFRLATSAYTLQTERPANLREEPRLVWRASHHSALQLASRPEQRIVEAMRSASQASRMERGLCVACSKFQRQLLQVSSILFDDGHIQCGEINNLLCCALPKPPRCAQANLTDFRAAENASESRTSERRSGKWRACCC